MSRVLGHGPKAYGTRPISILAGVLDGNRLSDVASNVDIVPDYYRTSPPDYRTLSVGPRIL